MSGDIATWGWPSPTAEWGKGGGMEEEARPCLNAQRGAGTTALVPRKRARPGGEPAGVPARAQGTWGHWKTRSGPPVGRRLDPTPARPTRVATPALPPGVSWPPARLRPNRARPRALPLPRAGSLPPASEVACPGPPACKSPCSRGPCLVVPRTCGRREGLRGGLCWDLRPRPLASLSLPRSPGGRRPRGIAGVPQSIGLA